MKPDFKLICVLYIFETSQVHLTDLDINTTNSPFCPPHTHPLMERLQHSSVEIYWGVGGVEVGEGGGVVRGSGERYLSVSDFGEENLLASLCFQVPLKKNTREV